MRTVRPAPSRPPGSLRAPLLAAATLAVAGIAMTASAAGGASAAPASFAPTVIGELVVEPRRAGRTSPSTLVRARAIRAELNRRIGLRPGVGLRVTEATTTASIASFTLLSEDLLERRFVPAAARGVWYAICPTRAVCPYPAPGRALPETHHLPRRLALELALRTFLRTDATVVGVSLPTSRFVALVVAREELAREVALAALYRRLRAGPLVDPPAGLRRTVDRLTRPRTYLFLGLEPGPTGGMSWAGMPAWPVLDRDTRDRPRLGPARR